MCEASTVGVDNLIMPLDCLSPMWHTRATQAVMLSHMFIQQRF